MTTSKSKTITIMRSKCNEITMRPEIARLVNWAKEQKLGSLKNTNNACSASHTVDEGAPRAW